MVPYLVALLKLRLPILDLGKEAKKPRTLPLDGDHSAEVNFSVRFRASLAFSVFKENIDSFLVLSLRFLLHVL